MFMLATNDLSAKLTMEKMLSLYKSQQSVEKGFRFLKSPDFLTSSLYYKKARENRSAINGNDVLFNGLCGFGV